jgi:Rad3-related DNA helicase
MREYSIAVRSLCEFTARSGDLSHRFTPAPTASQGIAGHRILGARRSGGYQRELTLRGRHGSLVVRGRADGYDAERNRLEEFKTHRGDLRRMPLNQRGLHWAQLKIYGALLCAERSLPAIELALVYFDVRNDEETALAERWTAADLQTHFELHCGQFLDWAGGESEHRLRRDRFLSSLAFPYGSLRTGQRRMAEAVYRAAQGGHALMVQAPTGIGKTAGALFPALKAVPAQKLDKVFYLTAKTSGRLPALELLNHLGAAAAPAALRVLELVSKDRACVFPGRACDAESCPLAKGFYDRLPHARLAAVTLPALTRDAVRAVAADADVCPYHLTQEMARWSDVVVGDYNHFFDGGAILHGLTVQNQWRIGVLVDEAHNLLPRAREMYSATLEPSVIDAAMACAPPLVQQALSRVVHGWREIHRGREEEYFVPAAIPAAFLKLLQRAAAAVADDVAEGTSGPAPPLLRCHFDVLHFLRMADTYGSHSLFDVTQSGEGASLCIRNVNPAPFLAPRLAACTTAVLFSATLSPAEYYRALLGVPAAAPWIDVESPFDGGQLEVRIAPRISTRYRDRERSLVPMADLMARQYRARPGNYLAFFGSFDYSKAALTAFQRRHPDVATWEQVRGMDGAARESFLAQFTPGGRGIGFAVLGGIFAEGVDLPGDRLIGAFIATLGMPRVCPVNAEIERRMHGLFGAGYEYTYLYPGLEKVVQAAGRVIRTMSDRGTVHLMDDRYGVPAVRDLLPRWWRMG